jgi:hypothetical protein
MNSDDESILSAYLDGELDRDQHERVDSALDSDPRAAEEVRSLAIVRDWVGSLSHENSVDVSREVMKRVRAAAALRRRPALAATEAVGAQRVSAWARYAAVAAAVVVAALLGLFRLRPVGREAVAGRPDAAAPLVPHTPATPAPPSPVVVGNDTDATPQISQQTQNNRRTLASDGAHSRRTGSAGLPAKSMDGQDVLDVHQLLDNPGLRRLFYVRNGGDGKSEQQVAKVVERTVERGYFKMSISQGVVIDPRHPGEATVFVLMVPPGKLDSLREQLKVALADQVDEGPADPKVVTQLAEIEHVPTGQAAAYSQVSIPRAAVALLHAHPAATDASQSLDGVSPSDVRAATPTPEQERSAPRPPPHVTTAAVDATPPSRERDAVSPSDTVVLVWVCKPRPSS